MIDEIYMAPQHSEHNDDQMTSFYNQVNFQENLNNSD